MQHLENDMDELFQRAAENYPLKKGKGDWESIAKRIADKTAPDATLVASGNDGAKKITALLILLLFIGAVSWFIFQHYQERIDALPNKNVLANTIKKAEEKTSTTKINKQSSADKNKVTVTEKKEKSNQQNSIGLGGNSTSDAVPEIVALPLASNITNIKPGREESLKDEIFNNESSIQPNNEFSPRKSIDQTNIDDKTGENKISQEQMLSKEKEESSSAALNVDDAIAHGEINKDKTSQDFKKKKGIYVGVAAGPDFSKVHSGSFDRSGVNAGIVAGYRVSKKISLESGISWDKKYYTSEGKNFSMDKIRSTMPSGMVINNLESNNSFVEIPLKIKFDVFPKSRSNLFVSGGVSAYIITREQNMYHVTYNGSTKNLLTVYGKNNYGLPAVANVSLGYEKSVFKNLELRIEPYLKIPLKGMGVGSLPVTSAGLQIGIIGRRER